MEDQDHNVLIQIAEELLKRLSNPIELVSIVRNAKNIKVDRNYSAIYIILKMPNTKSAVRRVRRVKKQTKVNRIRKSKYKNTIKHMDSLIKAKDKEKAKKYFPKFQSILMQVAKSGVVNKKLQLEKFLKFQKK